MPADDPKKPPAAPTWLLMTGGILAGLCAGLALLLLVNSRSDSGGWLNCFTRATRGNQSWGECLSNNGRIARNGDSAAAPAGPALNAPAPEFELLTLDGQPLRLSASTGKIRVLNFWATWCGPCQEEMPLLQETQERYGEQVTVLAVNNDETEQKVRTFVEESDLRLVVLLDPGAKITELYRVRGFPTTIFIDEKGVIRYQHLGALNGDTLQGYLDELRVSQ